MNHKELLAMAYNRKKLQGSKRANKLTAIIGSKRTSKLREINTGSKKSANYDRIITIPNIKNEIKIPYKNQVLKQIADGRYGSKIYQDISKKKKLIANRLLITNKNSNISGPPAQINKNEVPSPPVTADQQTSISENVGEPVPNVPANTPTPTTPTTPTTPPVLTTDQEKELIAKILNDDIKQNKPKKVSNTDPIMVQTKLIKTIPDITRVPKVLDVANLDKKISDMEDYIAALSVEIDRLKNNQKYIARAVERLTKNGSKSR